ncbi:hypothetical protein [Shewanella sp.]|uniref:hypothetical protein n=1 Tax=Shewanella sp. TaxID=50422 RepID=UPI002583A4D1|nr:hypothetical protein [Shewanella sp.]MCJ8302204.1 hypothetical protein [Shewanella sp.]
MAINHEYFKQFDFSYDEIENVIAFVQSYPHSKGEVSKVEKGFVEAIKGIEKAIGNLDKIAYPQLIIDANGRYEHHVLGYQISNDCINENLNCEREAIVVELELIRRAIKDMCVTKLIRHKVIEGKVCITTHNLNTGKHKLITHLKNVWSSKGNEATNHETSAFTSFVTYVLDQDNPNAGTKKSTIHDALRDTREKEKLGKKSNFECIQKNYKT